MEILFTHMSDELQAGYIQCRSYTNGSLAVQLMANDESYAILSIPADIDLPKDEFVAKTDFGPSKGLLEQFLENGIFSDTGKTTNIEHTIYPIYQLN